MRVSMRVGFIALLSPQAYCAAILLRQRRPTRRIIRMGCKPIRCTAAALAPSITSPARRGERFGPGALP